ncbi:hypothetical protein ER308_04560 [Egibacter rhizosphaerae]|uniref:Uncharacterized protein n=1 Tax=Egibacter rhizosphaerae TaxID=1670831 RepID=A0A411YCH0_9ACTN|nr:hypothetical protein [Egibacter rhizosphaerae]QBI18888.1 hypothetical protein ER308_04560 [Egibacter rhizosphaerae]
MASGLPRQRRGHALGSLGIEGRSTATTMLPLASLRHLRSLGEVEVPAKLLNLTDNRQDASLQSGHFNDLVQKGGPVDPGPVWPRCCPLLDDAFTFPERILSRVDPSSTGLPAALASAWLAKVRQVASAGGVTSSWSLADVGVCGSRLVGPLWPHAVAQSSAHRAAGRTPSGCGWVTDAPRPNPGNAIGGEAEVAGDQVGLIALRDLDEPARPTTPDQLEALDVCCRDRIDV